MEINNIKTMTDSETKELQRVMFSMLKYFDEFCKNNGLTYFLAGGCLIGAVRHKGFIPWDDDIDLFMPREDYEKLSRIFQNQGNTQKYKFCRTNKKENYHNAAASIRNLNTTFINNHSANEDICHGIALEIIPIDGCPNNPFSRFRQLFNAFLYGLFNAQRLPDNKGKFLRLIAKIVYRIVPSQNIRYYIWKHCEKQMSKYSWENCRYVTELIGSIKGMFLKHPKEDFSNQIYLKFEDLDVPIMKGYKRYLSLIWGNYMEYPPIEKQVAKHNTVYINTKEPYHKYKGIYYCKRDR